MNVLIVTEKPSVTRWIARDVRKRWPQADIKFAHAAPYRNIRFNYPRGLKLHEFPFVSEPSYRLAPWDDWGCGALALTADDTLMPSPMNMSLFTAADIIVCACDVDHTGAVSFAVLLEQVFRDDRALACPALQLSALDNASISKAFAAVAPFGEVFERALAYGRMKRYFDWNWNVNAFAILGLAERRADVPSDAPPLSKYALQLLYGLREQQPMTDGHMIQFMYRWPGTGRYPTAPGRQHPRLGSEASAIAILDNLLKAGLLAANKIDGRSRLALSVRGHTLLELLHPDCEDPDLPYRLDEWCSEGLASKPAVDRYIKTFFGKQKRFLDRR